MTSTQIMHAMDILAPEELAKVVFHVRKLDKDRQLSGSELTALAERMLKADSVGEADALQEAMVAGFFGKK
jgi:threonine synthase